MKKRIYEIVTTELGMRKWFSKTIDPRDEYTNSFMDLFIKVVLLSIVAKAKWYKEKLQLLYGITHEPKTWSAL